MKHLTRALAASALIVCCAACADNSTDPLGPVGPGADLSARNNITVMSRNLYIGFDADVAVAALSTGDPAIFGPVLQASVATLMNTDFATRANTIADEIAAARPHAVGLQEAWAIHADLAPLGLPMRIDLDYIDILQAALAARHLPYAVVARVIDTDGQPLPGIQLVDREALLVDTSRVTVIAAFGQTFATNIGVIAPGIDKKAGYIRAITEIGGRRVTFVTTHLESDLGPETHGFIAEIRAAQAAEIVAAVDTVPNVIVVGDMNDVAGSPMYRQFTGAGLVDSWATLNPRDSGLTDSCFSPDLADAAPHCQERIDFILVRGLGVANAGLIGKEFLVGLSSAERVPGPAYPLWPSDHAGVVGDFLAPAGRGLTVR